MQLTDRVTLTFARSRGAALGACALLVALACAGASAADSAAPGYTRSSADYRVPDLTLFDQNGKAVRLKALLDADEAVLMQFVFTSCATVCPVQAAVFSNAQPALDALGRPYKMVSISIDPEQDSPRELKQFASKFKAGAQWRFLTGVRQDIAQVLKAFGASLPANNKMFHQPYTYLHGGAGKPWVKLDGMLSLAELAAECQSAFGPQGAQVAQLAAPAARR